MGNNIDIDLFTQKSEITTSTPDITIEITGLVQLNSFIGLDDTPTYYENGKFFKVEDNKIVYTDINWSDVKGKIKDNPELVKEIGEFIQKETEQYTSEAVTKAIKAHDADANAHQSIQLTIQDNYTTLDNKIELNKIDSNTKVDQVNKRIDDNTEYITRVDNYSQEVNKKLEDLTLEVDVDIKGDINQLREDLTNTNEVIQNNYTTLDNKIDDTKSDLTESITQLTTVVNDNYTTLNSKIDGVQNNLDTTNQTVADNYTALDTKINTTKAELAKDVSDKYTALDTRISANTKDITDLTQIVQDDYKEINGHITDLYNKKVDKVEGKELSTNDFTNELKTKLENIETTAQVNIIESISVDGVPQTIDNNKNVDLHQPVYTLVEKDTPADTNIKEYNLTIDGSNTGVTIEIPKDVYIEKCTLKYVTVVNTPYTGAKVNDAYLQFDRANDTPIYTPIPELQIHAGQDIAIDENNVISTVIPIPRKISELNNDNYTVTDENYVHTDNNFTDGYIGRIESLEATTVKNVEYSKETQKITVTFGDTTTKILTLEQLLTGASYDGDTGNFTFTRANGEPVVVNTPKENFLSDVQYDGVTKVITFTMSSGATFEVNVSDLIDIYTVKSTNSVDMSIENGNKISSNVKVSATDGNIISVKTDGIYAKHQDISHLATKNEVNTKVDTATFTTELAKKADKTDVETELAKKVDTTTYTTGLATKVDKVEGKSLIENTEIERLKTLKNYDDTQIKTDITNINSALETKASTTDLENGLKTKQDKKLFDKSKFTVVGSPTITNDGIASGFTKGNYINIPYDWAKNVTNFKITGKFKVENAVQGTNSILGYVTDGYSMGLSFNSTSIIWFAIKTSSEDVNLYKRYSITPNIDYSYELQLNNNLYTFRLFDDTGSAVVNLSKSTSSPFSITSAYLRLGASGNYNPSDFMTGSIDLKNFSITVDGKEVFSGSKDIYQALAEKQNKLTAGTGIKIENNTISNTQTSAEWGNIQGDITAQEDLQNALNTKASTTSVTTLEDEVTDLSGRVTANEADIILKADKTALDTKQDKLVSGTNIKTINNESLLGEGNIEVKSGGGLEICDIGMALYVDESKGLRRYLNGQIVDINTNTQAFLNRLKEITTLHPSLLCTEEEWQTAKTMSAFGQVGKFVFNYSGDKIVSVRLPRVVNIQGLFDLQNLGMTVAESLPNIKAGKITTSDWGGIETEITGAWEGSMHPNYTNLNTGNTATEYFLSFNASRSSSTYKDGAPVQQEAIQYPYFIQIATGSETENNIINEIELNNPYSLFDSKYSDHELNNLSWLKSEGQWNSKAVYPDAYDELLTEYNNSASTTETEGSITFKRTPKGYKIALANQETAIDTKYATHGIAWYYILDTTNEKFKLPRTKFGFEGLRTSVGDDIAESLPNIKGGVKNDVGEGVYGAYTGAISLIAKRNNPIWQGATSVGRQRDWDFNASRSSSTYKDGAPVQERATQMYLYFYVGETVQNANLIDAGRISEVISEVIPNKLDKKQLYNKITNCLLEVPQRIKLALENGKMHLYKGSVLTYGDGTNLTIETDVIEDQFVNTTRDNLIMVYDTQRTGNKLGIYIQDGNVFSQDTQPTATIADSIWFDTANNKMMQTHDTGATWYEIPLPIGIASVTPNVWKSLDQVFNGMGYIGSTVWVDKGVKGLIPNGRNADGSLKNIEYVTQNLRTRTLTDNNSTEIAIRSGGSLTVYAYFTMSDENYLIGNNGDKVIGVSIASVYMKNNVITSFTPKLSFRAVDYNDKAEISGWGMPSSKYIDLTLNATGSSYTAPADGWVFFQDTGNQPYSALVLRTNFIRVSLTPGSSGNPVMSEIMPVKKGDIFYAEYAYVTGKNRLFRFIYAVGSEPTA